MDNLPKYGPWLWIAGWVVMVATALVFRPILPVDETRYVAVAWEMFTRDSFLVPYLNGEPYSHKPPLLFWLMQAGWGVFGVNDWWPRIVAPSFGLGCLFLTSHLAKRFWPLSGAAFIAPLLMIGSLFWGLYTTLTMFDLMLTFFVLLGLTGMVMAWQGRRWWGWLLFGLAFGFGILTKGPVVLVFLLPASLLAPLWMINRKIIHWPYWYGGVLGGIIIGVAIGLAWALPAGIAGGDVYRDAIFFGQTAGRLVNSFDHSQPAWWYLPFVPVVALPWILWPSFWTRIWAGVKLTEAEGGLRGDPGIRLALVWSLAALIILSAVSGKRLHYVLPAMPALALMGAAVLSLVTVSAQSARRDVLGLACLALLFGAIFMFAPEIGGALGRGDFTPPGSRWWGVPLLLISVTLVVRPPGQHVTQLAAFAGVSVALLVAFHGVARYGLSTNYDLNLVAAKISEFQRQGYKIANWAKYHGQYNFLGRLEETIETTGQGEVREWLAKNPNAKIVAYHYRLEGKPTPKFSHPFRGGVIVIWDGDEVRKDPTIPQRGQK